MTNQTTENFWAAWNAIPEPEEPDELIYRLYYDEQGFPLFYSMQEAEGNYIEVSKEIYHKPPKHVRVVDGKLRIYENTTIRKMMPLTHGEACDPRDVCVIVNERQPHIKWNYKQSEHSKYYDI